MRRYLSKLMLLATLVAPLAVFAVAQAQTPTTIQMTPTQNREPGLAGTTTITPTGANQVRVDIRITGLKPNDDRAAHIHSPGQQQDVCDTGGPVVYPLTDVKADASGVGTSTTNVTFDPAKGVPTAGWYVNVHVGAGANTGLGVICGKITASLASAGGQAAGGQTAAPSALPAGGTGGLVGSSGSDHTAWAIGLALAAVALAGTGLVFVRRRA